MSIDLHDEINDDEIRIITPRESRSESAPEPEASSGMAPVSHKQFSKASLRAVFSHDCDEDDEDEYGDDSITAVEPSERSRFPWFTVGLLLSVSITILICLLTCSPDDRLPVESVAHGQVAVADSIAAEVSEPLKEAAFVTARDTVVGGTALRILTPTGATPRLVIGKEALADSTAVLVAQAADVRGDNGQIAGAYVMKGDLLSRGEAKAGFCAIIDGEITVGVADATPMLEKAIESEGYFFRQFPLVVGGQVVENKPKGRSLRKALAEIDGKVSVVLSLDRLTFHDFSQALADAGVRNAVYLVGSTAAGFYTDEAGTRYTFGTPADTDWEYLNYIVWK